MVAPPAAPAIFDGKSKKVCLKSEVAAQDDQINI
jgi:hypothetical protein